MSRIDRSNGFDATHSLTAEPRERELVLDPEFLQSEWSEKQQSPAGELQLVLDPEFR